MNLIMPLPVEPISTNKLIEKVLTGVLGYRLKPGCMGYSILEFENTNPDYCDHFLLLTNNDDILNVDDAEITVAIPYKESNPELKKQSIMEMIYVVFQYFLR